jgi:hypothetical protein
MQHSRHTTHVMSLSTTIKPQLGLAILSAGLPDAQVPLLLCLRSKGNQHHILHNSITPTHDSAAASQLLESKVLQGPCLCRGLLPCRPAAAEFNRKMSLVKALHHPSATTAPVVATEGPMAGLHLRCCRRTWHPSTLLCTQVHKQQPAGPHMTQNTTCRSRHEGQQAMQLCFRLLHPMG